MEKNFLTMNSFTKRIALALVLCLASSSARGQIGTLHYDLNTRSITDPSSGVVNYPSDMLRLNGREPITQVTPNNGMTKTLSNDSLTLNLPFSLASGTTGKTLTLSNSLTFGGTDGKSLTLTGSLNVGADTTISGGGTLALGGKTVAHTATTTFGGVDGKTETFNNSLTFAAASDGFTLTAPATGTIALATGIAGGQTINGGTASGDNLTLSSTSNATKGKIFLGANSAYDGANTRLGIGITSPSRALDVSGDAALSGNAHVNGTTLDTTSGSFNLVNTNATTVNFAGAATTLSLGAPAAAINIGAGSTGTVSLFGTLLGSNLGYNTDIGQLSKKFKSLYAAELWVETLVAQDTMATTGGRILVGPTTELIADVATSDTTINVKHNNLTSGDRLHLEASGRFEFMGVTSGPTAITGGYSYSVTRDLDGTGANAWNAGDAVFNTGQSGNGFWDIFSLSSTLTIPLDFIYNFDATGSAFSANYNQASNWQPFADGANTQVNDAIYFGIQNTKWQNVYFNLIAPQAAYNATLVWEFWNGTTWTAFTPTFVGNTSGDFKAIGWQGFEWSSASLTGWAATTVNSQTAFWVRARISAFTSFATLPTEGPKRVYYNKGQSGPTQVLWKRNSSTWNDITEHAAFGDLVGFYGYGASTMGIALGEYATGKTHVTVDSGNGFRVIKDLNTVVNQIDITGNVKLGSDVGAASTTKLFISNASQTYNGETLAIGDTLWGDNTSASGKGNVLITAAGAVKVRRGVTDYITLSATDAQFTNLIKLTGSGAALSAGTTPPSSATAGTGLWLDRTGLYALNANTQNTTLTSAGLTAGAGNVVVDATGIALTPGTTLGAPASSLNWKVGSYTMMQLTAASFVGGSHDAEGQLITAVQSGFNSSTGYMVVGANSSGLSGSGNAYLTFTAQGSGLTGAGWANFDGTYTGSDPFAGLIIGQSTHGSGPPTHMLEVQGTGYFDSNLTLNANLSVAGTVTGNTLFGDTISIPNGRFYNWNLTGGGASSFTYTASQYAGGIILSGVNGRMGFFTTPSGTAGTTATLTERLTLFNTGGLFLGSSASDPGAGSFHLTGNLTVDGAVNSFSMPASTGDKIILYGTGTYGLGINAGEMSLWSGGTFAFHAGSRTGTTLATISNGGDLSLAGQITSYNGVATGSNGIPAIIGVNDIAPRNTGFGPVTLFTAPATGFYRISAVLKITTVGTNPVAGPITVTYTDGIGSVAQSQVMGMISTTGTLVTTTVNNSTTTGTVNGTMVIYAVSGTNVTIQIGTSGTWGVGLYAGRVRAEMM